MPPAPVSSHSGNAYQADTTAEARAIAMLECSNARKFAEQLARAEVPCMTVSVGSTPSCAAADTFPGSPKPML